MEWIYFIFLLYSIHLLSILFILLFFISPVYKEAQTNPQEGVQSTDRFSLRTFKWALKHWFISVLGDQNNSDLVSCSIWIKAETCQQPRLFNTRSQFKNPAHICVILFLIQQLQLKYLIHIVNNRSDVNTHICRGLVSWDSSNQTFRVIKRRFFVNFFFAQTR